MDSVRQWAFSLCAAMIACGIVQMLVPKASLERIFSLVVSVFFLCCLLSPMLLSAPGISIEIKEYSAEQMEEKARALSDVVERQQSGAEAEALEKIIAEKLDRMGIKYYSIAIDIITDGQSENACIATVVLDKAHAQNHNRIAEQLERDLGVDFRLGYQSAEEEEDD